MKDWIIRLLQNVLGFENYLFVFSIFKVYTLNWDSRKQDFIFFTTMFEAGDDILVIGACTGITTIPFAKKYPARKVFAVEPLPVNYAALLRVIRYFSLKNIVPVQRGLGSKSGKATMILPLVNKVKKQGLAHIDHPLADAFTEGEQQEILLTTLDELAAEMNMKVKGIKIVAENFESEIFKGARTYLQKNKPIIYCELWDNKNKENVLQLIQGCGYEIYNRKGKQLMPYQPQEYAGKNFFFLPVNE